MTPDPAWQRYWRYLTARFGPEVDEELEFHVAMRARELEADGLTAAEARREAERRFGDRQQVRTRLHRIERRRGYRMSLGFALQEVMQDVRYGVRGLIKRPAFTLMTATSLALGIAATTAVVSLVDSWLLRPLPGTHGDEILVIGASTPATGSMVASLVSIPTSLDVAARTNLFQDVAATRIAVAAARRDGSDGSEPRAYIGATGNYWTVLGLSPAAGRLFTPEDDRSRERVVVLSYRAWQDRFGADPGVVGTRLYLNTVPFEIIGVAQQGFRGTEPVISAEAFLPAGALGALDASLEGLSQVRDRNEFKLLARPQPGVPLDRIQQGLDLISSQLAASYPELGDEYRLHAVPEKRARPSLEASGGTVAAGLVFSVMALLVLVTAIVNAAGLILAHGTTRRTEMALRQALGASRGRVVRQLLTETLLLAILALGGGWLLAGLAIRSLSSVKITAAGMVLDWGLDFDARIFGMAVAITVVAGLVAGLGPSLAASRVRFEQRLREGNRAGGGRSGGRIRSALVVAQVAASAIVLVAAGLFSASVRQAARVDLGFEPAGVLTLGVDAGLAHYDTTQALAAFDRVEQAIRALPGVSLLAWAGVVPIERGSNSLAEIRTDATVQGSAQGARSIMSGTVGPDYFDVLRIPIEEGRAFTRADDSTAPPVAMVNRRAAEVLWPGRSAIGQVIRLSADGPPVEIVGVTKTSRYLIIGESPRPYLYLPLAQRYTPTLFMSLRTAGDPALLVEPVRRAIAAADRDLALSSVRPLTEVIQTSANGMLPLRLGAVAATAIGVLAVVLTLMGLYGVIACTVTERTRELGLRMALGATRGTVVRSVLVQGGRLAAIGIVLGLAAALVVSRALGGLLIGVSVTDVRIFAAAAIGLAAATLGSAYLPARRAARIDPVSAIRTE